MTSFSSSNGLSLDIRYGVLPWIPADRTGWWPATMRYSALKLKYVSRVRKKLIFRIAFKCLSELSFIVTTGNVTKVERWKVLNISLCWNIEGLLWYQDGLFVNLWRIPLRISMNYFYSRRLLECLFDPFELFLHIWQFLQIFLPG